MIFVDLVSLAAVVKPDSSSIAAFALLVHKVVISTIAAATLKVVAL